MLQKVRLMVLLVIVVITIIGVIFYLPGILGDVFYPLPSKEQLDVMKAAAQEFGVPVTLIVAVAKHESGFRAEALSSAGARGVMQIVPGTGAGLAKGLNISSFNVSSLFDPAINIRLGAYYLSQLLAKYNNDLRLTLAHYNAGPRGPNFLGDSNREVKVYRGVEGYARRVIATKAAYEQLYGPNLEGAQPVVKQEKSPVERLTDVKNIFQLLFQ